jgi:hypothetical protein
VADPPHRDQASLEGVIDFSTTQPNESASPHLHQTSLDGVIDFANTQPLEPDLRTNATRVFNQLIDYFEPSQSDNKRPYTLISLLRFTHEYAIKSDNFLSCFFQYVENESTLSHALPRFDNFDTWGTEQKNELATFVFDFAHYNFFLLSYLTHAVTHTLMFVYRKLRPERHPNPRLRLHPRTNPVSK